MSQSSDNRRIAHNTLVLYLRMLLLMAISLYTSRVVLATLGIEDYGISNVVGGIVTMFTFINGSMSSATQRYITFALGHGDEGRLSRVFSTSLQIHVVIAILIVLLGESVGLWFLFHKMQIPPGRMNAAFWVLQCSLLGAAVGVASVPYNAAIVAHERMSAFAYISVVEAVLKLAVVGLLVVSPLDKLILQAVLLLVVQVVIRFCYTHYCHRHFSETHYQGVWDRSLFREMTGFAGWSMFGNLASVLFGQGLNMLLNVFFGPVVNAARGVAVQVQGAVTQFVGNFQMALNPQITKTYAHGDLQEMHQLIFRSARFSFYLLFLLSLPVLLETRFILSVWLEDVPPHTVTFLRIMICTSLIYTLSNPLIVANQATGQVKRYQMVCGTILLLILPVSYVCLRLGCPAYSVFLVHFLMESLCQVARMLMLRPLIGIGLREYGSSIYRPVLWVIVGSVVVPALVHAGMGDGVLRFLAVGMACVLSVLSVAYLLGLSQGERLFVRGKAVAVVHRVMGR